MTSQPTIPKLLQSKWSYFWSSWRNKLGCYVLCHLIDDPVEQCMGQMCCEIERRWSW